MGPTAVGKSALALSWAKQVGAEIISADSTTVYRGVDIGTAKPTAAERQQVPHHLLDVADPWEQYTAARFQQDARAAAAAIHARGRVPLVVGGTGLFVRALLGNYAFAPPADPAVRQSLEAWADAEGAEPLRRQLRMVDPASYAAIAAGDRRRLVRALEVYRSWGRPLPRHAGPLRYRALLVGLCRHREELGRRIAARARDQLRAGLQAEMLALHAQGVPWTAPAFSALGYREAVLWARGRLPAADLLPLITRHTRQYAKRQLTWLRRDPAIHWLNLDELSDREALVRVSQWAAAFLTSCVPPG